MAESGSEPPGATHVVTCFVLRRDRGHDELLLVRRSTRVGSYQGAWAGVSGFVEPGVTPLDQAYTELHEEAALERADLRLLRSGVPVAVHDAALGRHWVVHPFLFAVADPARLRTDWEATEHQWAPPEALAQLTTVPKLAEALAAVYPAGLSGAASDGSR
jgi:ADP-ribose pyrophosphatase YjhB (NUDIX family)